MSNVVSDNTTIGPPKARAPNQQKPTGPAATYNADSDDWNEHRTWLTNIRDFVGGYLPNFTRHKNNASAPTPASDEYVFRAKDGVVWVNEGGAGIDLWRRLTKEPGFYDIRDYDAKPGASGKAATTAAFNAILAALSYSYFPTVEGKKSAVIYVPTVEDGWYVGDLNPYVGNNAAGIHFTGDMQSGRGGTGGSLIVYDGTLGGTMFDFQAINNSTIENLAFHMNYKALVGLKIRQYWNVANASQVGASGVTVRNCFIFAPQNSYDSIMIQAGSNDDPPNTRQTDTLCFDNVYMQGNDFGPGVGVTKQGWGFRDVVGGNTKNFTFRNCTVAYVYRGIEAKSGFLIVHGLSAAQVGYDRDKNASAIYTGAAATSVTGCGMESGSPGYLARFLTATQGAKVSIRDSYVACTPPADDVLIYGANAKVTIDDVDFQITRTVANGIAWTALTEVLEGQQRVNGGKWYVCTVPGTTGNTTGPTGTGSAITDGSVEWDWVTSTEGNAAHLAFPGLEDGGFGSALVTNCAFPYVNTPITAAPITDGTNPICPGVGGVFDFARSVNHALWTRGLHTGVFGGNQNIPLPDVNGRTIPEKREQFWTNQVTAGCTVTRNDSGVYAVTVPAAVVAAQGAGVVALGNMPPGYRITECLIDVTTLFSGPGVSTIKGSIGNFDIGPDDILLAGDLETVGQVGLTAAERGTGWEADRYIVPFGSAGQPYMMLKVTAGGGNVADINAGSLQVYVQFQRLKL